MRAIFLQARRFHAFFAAAPLPPRSLREAAFLFFAYVDHFAMPKMLPVAAPRRIRKPPAAGAQDARWCSGMILIFSAFLLLL
jgi:hypothetical protein